MKNLNRNKSLFILLPLSVSLIYLLITTFIIHRSPLVGVADQGDFERMFAWIGASYESSDLSFTQFNWVHRYYVLGELRRSDAFSSEIIFLNIAKFFNLMIHPDTFDLKILGLVHSVSFFCVVYLFLYQLKKLGNHYFYIATPFILFTLTDVGYISYFNSAYQESAGLIFLYLYFAMMLKAINEINSKNNTKNFWLLTVSSLLLITAKAQYFNLFIPIIIVNSMVFSKKIDAKLLNIVTIGVVLISIGYAYFGSALIIKKWNVYNTVFSQALGGAEDKHRAAKIIGIDEQFLKYSGFSAHMSESGINDETLEKELSTKTLLMTIRYYLLTPSQLISTSKEVSKRSFTSIVNYLGYYEYGFDLEARSQPVKFHHWQTIKQKYLTIIHPFLALFLLVIPLIFIKKYMEKKNKLLIPGVFLSIAAFCQFFIVVFTEGLISTEKHLFLYSILFDGLLLYLIAFFIVHHTPRIIHRK